MADAIRVEGLNAFVRNLKTLDAGLPKMVRLAFNDSADIVVQAARPGIPRRTGTAAASVKARSTQTASRVVGGGNKAPWYPWLDFGGKVGPKKSVVRPFFKDGRYIFAAYIAKRDSGEFETVMMSRLLEVVKAAGLEVD